MGGNNARFFIVYRVTLYLILNLRFYFLIDNGFTSLIGFHKVFGIVSILKKIPDFQKQINPFFSENDFKHIKRILVNSSE